MIQIKSIKQLKETAKDNIQSYRMYLKGGLFSRKEIIYTKNKFCVTNCIDDSTLILTEEELNDEEITLIGKAIKKGAFYYEN